MHKGITLWKSEFPLVSMHIFSPFHISLSAADVISKIRELHLNTLLPIISRLFIHIITKGNKLWLQRCICHHLHITMISKWRAYFTRMVIFPNSTAFSAAIYVHTQFLHQLYSLLSCKYIKSIFSFIPTRMHSHLHVGLRLWQNKIISEKSTRRTHFENARQSATNTHTERRHSNPFLKSGTALHAHAVAVFAITITFSQSTTLMTMVLRKCEKR